VVSDYVSQSPRIVAQYLGERTSQYAGSRAAVRFRGSPRRLRRTEGAAESDATSGGVVGVIGVVWTRRFLVPREE
jgi:hypothetical protein